MTTTDLTDAQAVTAKLRSNAQGGAVSQPHASRADEGPQVNITNWWPDLQAVPKNQPWDSTRPLAERTQSKRLAWPIENPGDVFDWGKRSTDGFAAWIRAETIPADVREAIGVTGQKGEMLTVIFVLAPLGGQSGGGDRNLVALVKPRTVYDPGATRMTPLMIVELGCDHAMRQTNLGRCYNRYDCTKCSYTYTVDSGD